MFVLHLETLKKIKRKTIWINPYLQAKYKTQEIILILRESLNYFVVQANASWQWKKKNLKLQIPISERFFYGQRLTSHRFRGLTLVVILSKQPEGS